MGPTYRYGRETPDVTKVSQSNKRLVLFMHLPILVLPVIGLQLAQAYVCHLCRDENFPGKPNGGVAVLQEVVQLPKPLYTCAELYYLGLAGGITERDCKPLVASVMQHCQCAQFNDGPPTNTWSASTPTGNYQSWNVPWSAWDLPSPSGRVPMSPAPLFNFPVSLPSPPKPTAPTVSWPSWPTKSRPTPAWPTGPTQTISAPTATQPTASWPTAAWPTASRPTAAWPTASWPTASWPTALRTNASWPTASWPTSSWWSTASQGTGMGMMRRLRNNDRLQLNV